MKASQIHEDFQNSVSNIGPREVDQARIAKNNGAAPLNVEGGQMKGISKDNKYRTKKV